MLAVHWTEYINVIGGLLGAIAAIISILFAWYIYRSDSKFFVKKHKDRELYNLNIDLDSCLNKIDDLLGDEPSSDEISKVEQLNTKAIGGLQKYISRSKVSAIKCSNIINEIFRYSALQLEDIDSEFEKEFTYWKEQAEAVAKYVKQFNALCNQFDHQLSEIIDNGVKAIDTNYIDKIVTILTNLREKMVHFKDYLYELKAIKE
ncbi:hypothetical protein SCLAR_v1c10140 [Spiroplasma clarkii]|uniref:Uncharacterized protein n=2 Tax=Spiroplasma clarkii TaxID=2139 RepID=A0A2K8KPX7_9MOLU|nr:hypothetical protein SCLAR_v1c10140 [Spiroplasma clarkii]